LGVKPGDRVGLLMMNSPEFLECFFGLAKIGAIVVPLNWRLAPPEIAYNAKDAGISALAYDSASVPGGPDLAGAVAGIRSDLPAQTYVAVGGQAPAGDHAYEDLLDRQPPGEPQIEGAGDDPLVIMYTSGTTGRPKGAVLTHNNLFYDSCTVSFSLDWRMGDRVLVALPLFHIGALIYVIIDTHVGSTTVLMKAFDPTGFLQTIETHQVNSFLAVPAMLNFMMQVPAYKEADLSSVRWALAGTAPVPVPLIQAWAKRGIAIQQVYGLTEATGGAAVLGPERALEKAGSTGLPMFHTDIRVVDEDGHDTSPGEVGEIIIRGPHVMAEYWNNPTATAETVKDGWLSTGDLGKFDDEGYLYIVERKKDMIISGGENIYPAEVENVLAEMAQIAEAAVVGIPDPDWGEAVCVVARLKEGQSLTLDEVVAHCAGKLGKYKIPKKLVLTDQPLPRTPAGKVVKRVLREKFTA
ncbi:MAG: long-chain fatty acid--CoA ligase, partial [Anaerolineae bacterium]